jgi:hypothetical protein
MKYFEYNLFDLKKIADYVNLNYKDLQSLFICIINQRLHKKLTFNNIFQ